MLVALVHSAYRQCRSKPWFTKMVATQHIVTSPLLPHAYSLCQAATCGDANGTTLGTAPYPCPTGYRAKQNVENIVIEFLTTVAAKQEACCELVDAACEPQIINWLIL
jgi:hypothetical protein